MQAQLIIFYRNFVHINNKRMFMEPKFNPYWKNDNRESTQEDFQKIVSVLNAHHIALWEYDILTGKCSFSNDYFRILGLSQIGIYFEDTKTSYSFIHPDDLQDYQKAFQEMLESEQKIAQIPYRLVGSRGEVVWVEDHFLSYQRNSCGHPEKLIAYTVNVTSKHEKELEISQLAERNSKIIEALPEFIFIFDKNLIITDVMIPPTTVLFHSAEELRGLDGRCIYSPEVCELLLSNIHACLQDNQLKEIEYPVDLYEQRFYYQARIVPFDKNRALALIHDIGDRVRRSKELLEAKRKAEEADQMKTLFLANMSHEIRTPLNAIVGFSEMISLAETEEEKKEYLEIIQKNSSLLLQLINDILDLSRIESGKSEMHLGLVSLSALVAEAGKVHRMKMPESVHFEVILPEEDVIVHTDRNRVTQVLSNFLSNAIKNTSKGTITLGVEQADEWMRLYVTDTGCGIAPDKLPLIFNRFEKLNDFVQGTGLGLPICKSIVERLGGRIDVQSEIGKGSTFSLYLHLNLCSVLENVPNETKKILIADDSEVAFIQINALLKKDYEILWARDGEEAMDSFLYDKPDLVLVDMRLSKLNGAQVIENIRRISASVPIVAVTEHSYYTDQQRARQAGCDDVITKPYTLDRLKERVDSFLKND